MCVKCDRMVILPCVEYDVMSGVDEEVKTTPKCEGCGIKFDANKLLVCPIRGSWQNLSDTVGYGGGTVMR